MSNGNDFANSQMVEWLINRVVNAGRGDDVQTSATEPAGRFWLGRLASEEAVANSAFGDRSERMEPCAIGIRIRPSSPPPWNVTVHSSACAWSSTGTGQNLTWTKTPLANETISLTIDSDDPARFTRSLEDLQRQLADELGVDELTARIQIDVEVGRGGATELTLMLVNDSPEQSSQLRDTGLYQTALCVSGIEAQPFQLESLPDSFRYDRRVPAYGINCGVDAGDEGEFRSSDVTVANKFRPTYWTVSTPEPELTFERLATDPLPSLRQLVDAHSSWTNEAWSQSSLEQREQNEAWSAPMRRQADLAAEEAREETARLERGLELLETDDSLRRAFQMMNEAMIESARGRGYASWRPFQVGFLLANLSSITAGPEETGVVDILWFATGGGKTETYLGLLVMAAFHDRMTGKSTGVTAWSRFPAGSSLPSLQQTQRFADALAGAEIVRRRHRIDGDPYSLGFFVGSSSTPNRILQEPNQYNPDDAYDDDMPGRYRILLQCPFCRNDLGPMRFDHEQWRLMHCCENDDCEWPEEGLPLFIVDEEIYRFLPTIIVGTLDKVALVGMQAAMRGLVAAPYARCSETGHGFTYAPRASKPSGCLVPGCRGHSTSLPMDRDRFAPSFRLQDELHLLRDSLGAIDAHYERLLDHLAASDGARQPKIVASSATLTGYERQCDVLYNRSGRVFPAQGPTATESFWSGPAERLLRNYVSLAPRGATLEFAADRIVTVLQESVRELRSNRDEICAAIGVDVSEADSLISLYGTDVVYGNTIRDLDASVRSLETQIPVQPLISASLTGQTPFPEVRVALERLENPEESFDERIHVVAASSMMSHGVDVDRLNLMVMLGLPLATAEFIQATARIGRRYPGAVFVLHKMALERDASVFRSFKTFVDQGDRFVEAIPVTKRSCRVLERTMPGLEMARLLHIHEPESGQSLTRVPRVRDYFQQSGITNDSELEAVIQLLDAEESLDEQLRTTAQEWLRRFFRELDDPATTANWPAELLPDTPVMKSLRDVEEQAPIVDRI